jgi:hypothetical protein
MFRLKATEPHSTTIQMVTNMASAMATITASSRRRSADYA